MVKTYEVCVAPNPPEPGQYWRHRNGCLYYVLGVSNTANVRDDHPSDVVYYSARIGVPDPSKLWTRPLTDWHRSFNGPLLGYDDFVISSIQADKEQTCRFCGWRGIPGTAADPFTTDGTVDVCPQCNNAEGFV